MVLNEKSSGKLDENENCAQDQGNSMNASLVSQSVNLTIRTRRSEPKQIGLLIHLASISFHGRHGDIKVYLNYKQ
jgi:hypothetical protein